jgi:TldD protein
LSQGKLESEISDQIPANVNARTAVHFGIRYAQDPRTIDAGTALANLKNLIDRCRKAAPAAGLNDADLTYVAARQTTAEEDSIFIDPESNLSQTLLRQALTLITMSESDRTHLRVGGLGGLEAIEIEEKEISQLLTDLAALKKAQKLEPGKYRVLFGPVLAGVLAHEAFGHSQEADTCARGRSKAWELFENGKSVGNDNATILNNPAIFETGGKPFAAWGTYFFDEEGWLAQSQVLLDQGILRAPMTNLTSAIRLGVPRTANGKRESWANGVYTRQTNTYFSPGKKTLKQLMTELNDGFLATVPAGGMEDPKGMGIQVGISYLQEVKAGVATGRVFKGPAGGDIQLTGYTPDVLNSIIDKSKIEFDSDQPDSAKHPWNDAGGCGKYHKEFVFAGCGGPYMLLDQVILG